VTPSLRNAPKGATKQKQKQKREWKKIHSLLLDYDLGLGSFVGKLKERMYYMQVFVLSF
jgi:hypothetical protein